MLAYNKIIKLLLFSTILVFLVYISPTKVSALKCCSDANTDCASGQNCVNRNDSRVGSPLDCPTPGKPKFCVSGTAADPTFELPTYDDVLPAGSSFAYGSSSQYVIGTIITDFLPYVFVIAGLLLLAYLLYGGFHLATSFGSPQAILEAWHIIFRALIGFILVFGVFWLMKLLETILGLCILGNCT